MSSREVVVKTYNCLITYLSHNGARRVTNIKTCGDDADAALSVAEKLLYKDRRRAISYVVNRKATEQ